MSDSKRHLPVLVERSVDEVHSLQLELDRKLKFESSVELSKEKKAITCQPGCASCCYHPITISALEGILIYRWLQNNGRWTTALKKKLQESSDQQFGVSYEVWLLSLIPCPLLDENKLCSVYEVRPFVCRSYMATSDPYYCHPHRLGPDTELVDRKSYVVDFHREQERILKQHNVQMTVMPIGTALLLGEQLCSGSIDLGSIDRYLMDVFTEKG